MAVTVHREPNRVKWIGVRPGHEGEQILKSATVVNGNATLYTVPADKLLLLFNWGFSAGASAALSDYFLIRDELDATYLELFYSTISANTTVSTGGSMYLPMEIIAGYDFYLVSAAATTRVSAFIHGILIDV